MDSDTKYTFNIVNFDKNNSQFANGMQPLLFSRKSNRENGENWHRVGTEKATMIYRRKRLTLKEPNLTQLRNYILHILRIAKIF